MWKMAADRPGIAMLFGKFEDTWPAVAIKNLLERSAGSDRALPLTSIERLTAGPDRQLDPAIFKEPGMANDMVIRF